MSRAACLGLFVLRAAATTCNKDTGGRCFFLPCDESRGPTICDVSFDLRLKGCFCPDGYCAGHGQCWSQPSTSTPEPNTSTPEPETKKTTPEPPVETTRPTPTTGGRFGGYFVDVGEGCKLAFEIGCPNYGKFQQCCKKTCKASYSDLECYWDNHQPCCRLNGQYNFAWNNMQCQRACSKLGSKRNSRMDYCQGGLLEEDDDVKSCQVAIASLHDSQDKTQMPYCSEQALFDCKWKFDLLARKLSISGEFSYGEHNAPECRAACNHLGSGKNSASDYCSNTHLWHLIQGCHEAIESFKNPQISGENEPSLKDWCKSRRLATVRAPLNTLQWSSTRANLTLMQESSRTLEAPLHVPPSRVPPGLRPITTEQDKIEFCHLAYKKSCFMKDPFKDCCGSTASRLCFNSEDHHTCSWTYHLPGYPPLRQKILQKKDSEVSFEPCKKACDYLGSKSHPLLPSAFCKPDLAKTDPLKDCSFYQKYPLPKAHWCGQSVLTSTGSSPSSYPGLAVGGTLLLVATASVAVKLRSRLHSVRDVRERLLVGA